MVRSPSISPVSLLRISSVPRESVDDPNDSSIGRKIFKKGRGWPSDVSCLPGYLPSVFSVCKPGHLDQQELNAWKQQFLSRLMPGACV